MENHFVWFRIVGTHLDRKASLGPIDGAKLGASEVEKFNTPIGQTAASCSSRLSPRYLIHLCSREVNRIDSLSIVLGSCQRICLFLL